MRIKPLVLKDGRVSNLAGTDLLDQDNFSYVQVQSGELILVPEFQSMVSVQGLIVEGEIDVDGDIILDQFTPDAVLPKENFSFKEIVSGKTVLVEQAQQMLVITEPFFEVDGEIQIDGMVILDEIKDTEILPSVIPADNFSYKTVIASSLVSVPSNQQMVVDGLLTVEGELDLEGQLSIFSDEREDSLPQYWIEDGEEFTISRKKQMLIVDLFRMDGRLNIEGTLALGA